MIFRKLFDGRIDALRSSYESTNIINHAGTKGKVRELFVKQLLDGFLHPDYSIGRGICIDRLGMQSPECDVIIYDRSVVPPIFISEQPFIPIDSVTDIIEVKSKLTNDEIKDCINKADKLYRMKTAGYFFRYHLFAFDSDLAAGVPTIKRLAAIAKVMGKSDIFFRQTATLDRDYSCKIGEEDSITQAIMDKDTWENRNDIVAAFVAGIINNIYEKKGNIKVPPGYFIFGNYDSE